MQKQHFYCKRPSNQHHERLKKPTLPHVGIHSLSLRADNCGCSISVHQTTPVGWFTKEQHGKLLVKIPAQKFPFFWQEQKEDPTKQYAKVVQANKYPTQWISILIASWSNHYEHRIHMLCVINHLVLWTASQSNDHKQLNHTLCVIHLLGFGIAS